MNRAFLLCVLALLPAFGAAQTSAEDDLRVCVDSRPRFFDRQDGAFVGVEHDILAGYARARGRRLDVRWDVPFQQLFDRLLAGDCDVVAAMLTPTEEREKRMDFSESYFPVFSVVLGSERQPVYEIDDLQGLRVATIEGTSQHEALVAVPEVRILHGGTYHGIGRMVADGEADALVCDSAFVPDLLDTFPELRVGPMFSGRSAYAFALAEGSALKTTLDDHIRELVRSGEYQQILKRYFDDETVDLLVRPDN